MISHWKTEWNVAPSMERATFIVVAAASLLSIFLGILNYPVIGHDAYVHLNWLDQFTRLTSTGIFYPRWLSDSFGGFGAPTFYFYPPLVYWVASVFYLIWISSTLFLFNILQLFFSFLSVGTCFWLLRQLGGTRFRSLAGALLFSFLAYRFCDVYVRDALTEHAALAFLPLIFLRFNDKIQSLCIQTVGWSLLLLTNLPIVYLAIVATIVTTVGRRSWKEIPFKALSLILAIAISALYVFPAFALRGLIHQRHLFDLPMHTSQFGFALLDMVQSHFDWLRILSIATIIASLFFLLKTKGGRRWSVSEWHWLLIVGIFFQIPFISTPVWHLIPGISFVQFSWRWNGMLLLAIAVVIARGSAGTARLQCYIVISLALVTILSELTLSRNLFERPLLPINSYRMDAPEYAPKWAANDPNEVIGITLRRMSDPPALLLGLTLPDDSIYLERKMPHEWDFFVRLQRETSVRFHQFYWPYWKLYKDSTEISLSPDANGFATAQLPAGAYRIALQLEKSSVETIAMPISIGGLAILLALAIISAYRTMTNRRETTMPSA